MTKLEHIHPLLLGAAVMAVFVLICTNDAHGKKDRGRYAGPLVFLLMAIGLWAGSRFTPNPF